MLSNMLWWSLALLTPVASNQLVNPDPGKQSVAFDSPYDRQNPFARILRGELPVAKVYESRDVLVFMDSHPRASGHMLVIAKHSEARNILEMSPKLYAELMIVSRRMAGALRFSLRPDGIIIQQNNGIAQSVPHLHIHVIPVYAGEVLAPAETTTPSVSDLINIGKRIKATVR